MSNPYRHRARRLAVLGGTLVAVTACLADGPARPPTVATAAPGPAAAAEPAAPAVLLLADGRVVDQGTIVEADDGYLVRSPFGERLIPRRQVERAFGSMGEVYAYKLTRLPPHDPDERMKLAQWCLQHELMAEAREQLQAILASVPESKQAKAMLFQIEAAAGGAAPTDAALQRTGGESIEPPATLSLKEIRDAYGRNGSRPLGPPVVLDLPAPQAIKRYQEFGAYIHQDLQRSCARCHNERSPSAFQLIEAQSQRDMKNELLVRANLDAVLRLVDAQDPSRSPLLGAAIMPHKPDDKPILTGPNHPTYRRLAYWLGQMKSPNGAPRAAFPTGAEGVAPAAYQAAGAPAGSRFAADRRGGAAAAPGPSAASPGAEPQGFKPMTFARPPAPDVTTEAPHSVRLDTGATAPIEPKPPGQLLPGSAVGMPRNPPPAADFRAKRANRPAAGAPPGPPAGEASRKKTVNVPGIGEVEVVDLDNPPPKPEAQGPSKGIKGKQAQDALQKFMTNGRR